ncbi:transglutaminase domain-containing protein [Pseudobacter ginsenosidimutans]|uniref:Transglutaminase superfamily protein n=1 Tax=Pseudobacter ginsenosidimutans TaxID=661488 RepID=A0A4Q7N313_9BACT|nr:transglutaminase family protein [Pseudobacter ginsenosidimutans]QEC44016.1 hypothetical protein FSB84_20900 [Pseudobacter ginsenosidimutans]RZS75454.1 transglutaminase superfamily protein [Pseudobacter ginsenosidimutans]
MNKRKQLLLLIFLYPIFSFAQLSIKFASVDSFASQVKYRKDFRTLTEDLTSPYSEPLLKARSIFKWITENIRYNYKYYNKYYYQGREPKSFTCKDNKDCESKRIAWEINYIETILRKKKAVCYGYAMLFKKMCDIAGLQSEIIPGYVRTEYYQVGTAGTLDHAWNAVWVDSTWHLLDPTWAAGGCAKNDDGKMLSFTKKFNNYYWLTSPENFARNHFPKNNKWTLLQNYTKDSFALNPYYAANAISKIRLMAPGSGVIHSKKGDTVHFRIGYEGPVQDIQINSNYFRNPEIWVYEEVSKRKKVRKLDSGAVKKQQYIQYQRVGNTYEFYYLIPDNSLYYLDILFNRNRVMRFKVVTSHGK